jgi:hypothetical protein
MKGAGQHRSGAPRVAQAPTVGDRHRFAELGRPPRPWDAGLDKPVGGYRRSLAGPAFGDRTDRQQHRQRLGGGPSLELRDEPAEQRLLEPLTGDRTDRHERRAHDLRVQRVLGHHQVRGACGQLVDQPPRVEVLTRTSRATARIRRAEHVRWDRPPGGLLVLSAFPATAHRAHPPSLPDPPASPRAPCGACQQRSIGCPVSRPTRYHSSRICTAPTTDPSKTMPSSRRGWWNGRWVGESVLA